MGGRYSCSIQLSFLGLVPCSPSSLLITFSVQECMLRRVSWSLLIHFIVAVLLSNWHCDLYIYIGGVVKEWDCISVFSQNQVLVPAKLQIGHLYVSLFCGGSDIWLSLRWSLLCYLIQDVVMWSCCWKICQCNSPCYQNKRNTPCNHPTVLQKSICKELSIHSW